MPVGAASFSEALRTGAEVFHALKRTLHERGLATAVGDEGGFAPDLELERGGAGGADRRASRPPATRPATDVAIALDPATSEIYDDGVYVLEHEGRALSRRGDGRPTGPTWPAATRSSRSRTAWTRRTGTAGSALTEQIGDRVQLVGDDLFVTNTERLRRGIESGVANSILVKVNQIGTLTETLDAVAHGPGGRLHRGDVPPLRRDRGHDDRRPGRGHGLRPDQDRRAVALGPGGEVQPAAAHRGGAGRRRASTRAAASSAASAGRKDASIDVELRSPLAHHARRRRGLRARARPGSAGTASAASRFLARCWCSCAVHLAASSWLCSSSTARDCCQPGLGRRDVEQAGSRRSVPIRATRPERGPSGCSAALGLHHEGERSYVHPAPAARYGR